MFFISDKNYSKRSFIKVHSCKIRQNSRIFTNTRFALNLTFIYNKHAKTSSIRPPLRLKNITLRLCVVLASPILCYANLANSRLPQQKQDLEKHKQDFSGTKHKLISNLIIKSGSYISYLVANPSKEPTRTGYSSYRRLGIRASSHKQQHENFLEGKLYTEKKVKAAQDFGLPIPYTNKKKNFNKNTYFVKNKTSNNLNVLLLRKLCKSLVFNSSCSCFFCFANSLNPYKTYNIEKAGVSAIQSFKQDQNLYDLSYLCYLSYLSFISSLSSRVLEKHPLLYATQLLGYTFAPALQPVFSVKLQVASPIIKYDFSITRIHFLRQTSLSNAKTLITPTVQGRSKDIICFFITWFLRFLLLSNFFRDINEANYVRVESAELPAKVEAALESESERRIASISLPNSTKTKTNKKCKREKFRRVNISFIKNKQNFKIKSKTIAYAKKRDSKVNEEFFFHTTFALNRPLFSIRRKETKQLCTSLVLPAYPDKTNQQTYWLRNRIRKQLLPAIRILINPQFDTVFCNFSDSIQTVYKTN